MPTRQRKATDAAWPRKITADGTEVVIVPPGDHQEPAAERNEPDPAVVPTDPVARVAEALERIAAALEAANESNVVLAVSRAIRDGTPKALKDRVRLDDPTVLRKGNPERDGPNPDVVVPDWVKR